jgi:hypothetical protein
VNSLEEKKKKLAVISLLKMLKWIVDVARKYYLVGGFLLWILLLADLSLFPHS